MMFAVAALAFALSLPQDTIGQPTVIVVRHAEKASQTERDPTLSAAGIIRAEALDSVVLVVGHSNTVLPIIRALGGPTLLDLCDSSYAQLFSVTIAADGSGRLVRSQYGAPDPVGPTYCAELPRR